MAARPDSAPRIGRRPALDGLRGVAVALVVAVHVGLLAGGTLGVDVFLPLSGFLITALLLEEWDRRGTISLRRFLGRRVRRLLPALLLAVGVFSLAMVILHPFGLTWPLGRIDAVTLLFAGNWVATVVPGHGSVLSALSPTWTLAEEGQFYLLWPGLLLWLLRHRLGHRELLLAIGLAITALVGLSTLLGHLLSDFNAYTDPPLRGVELLLGAGAAVAWRARLMPGLLRRRWAGPLLAAAIAVLIARAPADAPLTYLATAALSALLIVHLLQDAGAPVERLLARRELVHAGRVSYGTYLFHVPIYYLLWTYVKLPGPAVYAPVVLALALTAATLSHRLLEVPVLRGARSRSSAPRLPLRALTPRRLGRVRPTPRAAAASAA
jgi:peptidoglycan/LPS O-acetylase OafA/YrhL